MARPELERICCGDWGMNRNSFYIYLTYSPILEKYGRGVYGLRGARVPPGLVERLAPPRRRGRVLKDYGWTANGNVWVGYKLSEAAVTTGLISIPAAMSQHVLPRYDLFDAEGAEVGQVRPNGESAWRLSSYFSRRGGDPGDFLVLELDRDAGRAVVHVGDRELLETFAGDDDEDAAQDIREAR